jgi:predicted lipoprotein
MFSNYSSNLILPNYTSLNTKLDSLTLAIQNFNTAPSTGTLAILRSSFMSSYKQYLHVSMFEFGPASTQLFRSTTNIFPTDTTQINSNIASGSYDFNSAANTDAIGFPAMDFLLYGYNKSDGSIINLFSASANRRQYLADVCAFVKTKLSAIISGWSSYQSTFNSATGNASGASLSNIVNELNYDFEITKNARVGIPLGKQTLGIPLPEKVEGYYSTRSLTLLAEHINGIENFYLGRSLSGIDGLGLDDYLDHKGAMYGSESLNSAIKTKFSELKSLIASIPGPLATAVVSNPTPVENTYIKIQQLLVLLKTDMPSALSVYITYVDGDGD